MSCHNDMEENNLKLNTQSVLMWINKQRSINRNAKPIKPKIIDVLRGKKRLGTCEYIDRMCTSALMAGLKPVIKTAIVGVVDQRFRLDEIVQEALRVESNSAHCRRL